MGRMMNMTAPMRDHVQAIVQHTEALIGEGAGVHEVQEWVTRAYLIAAVKRGRGNYTEAARIARCAPATLRKMAKRLKV